MSKRVCKKDEETPSPLQGGRSRRAASKEALKLMQKVLHCIDHYEEEPTKENTNEATTKKRFKKSPPITIESSSEPEHKKNLNAENTLELEIWVEELSEVQREYHNKQSVEKNELLKKLEALLNVNDNVQKTDITELRDIKTSPPTPPPPLTRHNSTASLRPRSSLVKKTMPKRSKTFPRIKLVKAQSMKTSSKETNKAPPVLKTAAKRCSLPQTVRKVDVSKTSVSKLPIILPKPSTVIVAAQKIVPTVLPQLKTVVRSVNLVPNTVTIEGGLALNSNHRNIVEILEGTTVSKPDGNEVYFPELREKTFPSLTIVVQPSLCVKDFTKDREKLNDKVKTVITKPPDKFTEWLLQEGLIKSKQTCPAHLTELSLEKHRNNDYKLSCSGGYAWKCDFCPINKLKSVFHRSFFALSPYPPVTILKLIYHWACQTSITNIKRWVKAEPRHIKAYFKWIRAVCMNVNEKYVSHLLGGPKLQVELSIIALGMTSKETNKHLLKVYVLGMLETHTKRLKLYAVEHAQRTNILEPLKRYVYQETLIVTDLSIDEHKLNQLGFNNVIQSDCSIKQYLTHTLPKMFKETLPLITCEIIQQFLDELVWREMFGTTVLQAFNNILKHISEQTVFDDEAMGSLLEKLNKIATNPTKTWESSVDTETHDTEKFYYGTINIITEKRTPKILIYTCVRCKEVFANNIILMQHLFKHAQDLSSKAQLFCKYCLVSVSTRAQLERHVNLKHPMATNFHGRYVCLICENMFSNEAVLEKHLSQEHCQFELPYKCGGSCAFRCSNHRQAVDHFYEAHRNDDAVQCPFCLESTILGSQQRQSNLKMNEFIAHLQWHQREAFTERCGKCKLLLPQNVDLKEHQSKMHASQSGKPGLVPGAPSRSIVVIPEKTAVTTVKVPPMLRHKICKECNKRMNRPKHFSSLEGCSKANCKYFTGCLFAMNKHRRNCSEFGAVVPIEELPYKMFCGCGFSATDGNVLAQHLVSCGKTSAYPKPVGASSEISHKRKRT